MRATAAAADGGVPRHAPLSDRAAGQTLRMASIETR
jgi:hypothetical protein